MGYRLAQRVAWSATDGDSAVIVMKIPDGKPLVYLGSAALIWEIALETPDVVQAVADVVGEEPEDIAASIRECLNEFVLRGLLVAARDQDGAPRASANDPPSDLLDG